MTDYITYSRYSLQELTEGRLFYGKISVFSYMLCKLLLEMEKNY
jgi:hypothetical protein